MQNSYEELRIVIGKILKPHGIQGAVKVLPMTDDPNRFQLLDRVVVRDSYTQKVVELSIEDVNIQADSLFIKFVDVNDRNSAEKLRDNELLILRNECLPLEDGVHYIFDLEGLNVEDTNGQCLGKIDQVLQYPAHDIYVMQYHNTEVMIPAVSEFVKKIEIAKGRIIINTMPGLLPDEE
ncbi:MAG: 16S rRNA processing protein RimM [Deferribacteres bacterium]|nr:16S rRNA processing protein RimM [candidate division KSB1 bacterium]MCB9503758.1 16S rRNA processing protein RimM [Deferribacteres bacterium]